jgi:hypothetical protein
LKLFLKMGTGLHGVIGPLAAWRVAMGLDQEQGSVPTPPQPLEVPTAMDLQQSNRIVA